MRRPLTCLAAAVALAVAPLIAASPVAGVGPAAPTNGLVLHYAMETLTQSRVMDSSPNALHGLVTAASGTPRLVTSLTGYGRAIQLTGTQSQWIDVPSAPVLDVDRYTLSSWVRYTGVQNSQTLGRWEILEKADSYWMNVRTNGRVRVGGFYGGCTGSNVWQYLDSSRALTIGRWTHVASTYDGTWLRVYIDGTAVGSKRVSGRTCVSGEPLAVGAKNHETKGLLEAFWDGRLDDVRIYNRALTQTEVRQLATRP